MVNEVLPDCGKAVEMPRKTSQQKQHDCNMSFPLAPPDWKRWIHRLVNREWPTRVYLAHETGTAALRGGLPIHPSPRFSLCLAGTGRYTVLQNQKRTVVSLQPGDCIAALPHALMEPDRSSRYLAIGLVFTPEMTRMLLAKQSGGRHRFLNAHHSSVVLDSDGHHLFEALRNRSHTAPEDLIARRLVELLLLKAAEMAAEPHLIPSEPGRKARFTWQAACQFLEEHLHHPIGREDVARFLQVHPNHISRLFREFSQRTFHDHLLQTRLHRARSLLTDPALNITEIAHACGFRDSNYFIRCYRKSFGEPPGRQRTNLRPRMSS